MKKVLLGLVIFIALLIAGGGTLYVLSERDVPLDDAARAKAPGQFAELSQGKIFYRWDRPARKTPVVMVHGFSMAHWVFDYNVPDLNEAGLEVLRMDNYGRGWSDRINGEHQPDVFDQQLLELLDNLGVDQPVDLVGLSMGGAIAVHFAAKHPERVRKLALIAPAGLPSEAPLITQALKIEGVGEWLARVVGPHVILNQAEKVIGDKPALVNEVQRNFKQTMDYQGYFEGLLSTVRHFPLNGMEEQFRNVGQQDRKVLVLWGEADSVVPFPGEERLRKILPNAEVKTYPGEDHALNMTRNLEVNVALIRFLTQD